MATTRPCYVSTPIESWRTCNSNCMTLSNIQNVSPVDAEMHNWTFVEDSTGTLSSVITLQPSPQWIPMGSSRTGEFGTTMDGNWNFNSVASIPGFGSPVGWYQLTYTNPLTKVTSTVGCTVLSQPVSLYPPILTIETYSPNYVPAYFQYVPAQPNAIPPVPGRMLVLTYLSGPYVVDVYGRSYPDVAYPAVKTPSPTIYDVDGILHNIGPTVDELVSNSPIGIYQYITNTTPTSTLLSVRIVNPTQPSVGYTDTANNNPADTVLPTPPGCTVQVPAPNTGLFPQSSASISNSKKTSVLKWVIGIIAVVLLLILLIVVIIIIVVSRNQRNRTAALNARIDKANIALTNAGITPDMLSSD